MPTPPKGLRLGTRGSLLARRQSQWVADQLQLLNPSLQIELHIIKTTGDQITDRPLQDVGGKGLFTKELENALLAGAIDFAVHSFKDVPVTEPLVDQQNLIIPAMPPREDCRDLLVSPSHQDIMQLPRGASVGTGSLRRRSQLLAVRSDLSIQGLRGNIDTRLARCKSGAFDAIILATAGLHRSQLFDPTWMSPIDPQVMVPSAGQGALALQCRADDSRTQSILVTLDDSVTHRCVTAERRVVRLLNADCHSPLGVLATEDAGIMTITAALGSDGGGSAVRRAQSAGPAVQAEDLARRIADQLLA